MTKLGVFTNAELKQLKRKHRATLKKHVLRFLRTSPEIRTITRRKLHSTFRRFKSQSK